MLKRTLITLIKEALRSVALLLLVTVAMFAVLSTAPGDPVSLFVNVQSLSAEELATVRHELGLDRSLPARYGAWLIRLAHGDLGTSLRSGQPVTVELWRDGQKAYETVTDSNGDYSFTGLVGDTYRVRVTDDSGVLGGYDPTYEKTEGVGLDPSSYNGAEDVDVTRLSAPLI